MSRCDAQSIIQRHCTFSRNNKTSGTPFAQWEQMCPRWWISLSTWKTPELRLFLWFGTVLQPATPEKCLLEPLSSVHSVVCIRYRVSHRLLCEFHCEWATCQHLCGLIKTGGRSLKAPYTVSEEWPVFVQHEECGFLLTQLQGYSKELLCKQGPAQMNINI